MLIPEAIWLGLLFVLVALGFADTPGDQATAGATAGDGLPEDPPQSDVAPPQFNAYERRQLLALARRVVEAVVRFGELPSLDDPTLPALAAVPVGMFCDPHATRPITRLHRQPLSPAAARSGARRECQGRSA